MSAFRSTLAALALVLGGATAHAEGADQADRIMRGQYQAVLGDCMACHTRPGGAPYAGGAPLETPFGRLVPPNITQDPETGIGNWTEADFTRMMRTGIGHQGRRLYPAMPYPAYSMMTDQDIADLWAYMATVQPVRNAVVANQLPFPFNIRLVMWGWNLLNFRPQPFRPDPAQSEEWNRGAYLVQGPGHCGSCHTPKNIMGADDTSRALRGASLQGWFAPDITGNSQTGIGGWSQEELVAYLRTGVNTHSVASGPMREAVENSTSRMSDADLRAIAVYLRSRDTSAPPAPAPLSATEPRMQAGAAVYAVNCAACHGGEGRGARQLFPALAGNPLLRQANPETLVHLVLAGSQGAQTPGAPTTPAMPSLGWRLNDQQVADVLTYVRNSWGNAAPPVAPGDVAKQRNGAPEIPWALLIGGVVLVCLLVLAASVLMRRRRRRRALA
jgi:mono/diheme cytochrome c family protein